MFQPFFQRRRDNDKGMDYPLLRFNHRIVEDERKEGDIFRLRKLHVPKVHPPAKQHLAVEAPPPDYQPQSAVAVPKGVPADAPPPVFGRGRGYLGSSLSTTAEPFVPN